MRSILKVILFVSINLVLFINVYFSNLVQVYLTKDHEMIEYITCTTVLVLRFTSECAIMQKCTQTFEIYGTE